MDWLPTSYASFASTVSSWNSQSTHVKSSWWVRIIPASSEMHLLAHPKLQHMNHLHHHEANTTYNHAMTKFLQKHQMVTCTRASGHFMKIHIWSHGWDSHHLYIVLVYSHQEISPSFTSNHQFCTSQSLQHQIFLNLTKQAITWQTRHMYFIYRLWVMQSWPKNMKMPHGHWHACQWIESDTAWILKLWPHGSVLAHV